MPKGLPHQKLEEALREHRQGCAICRLVDQTGRRYLDNLLYEMVNDPDVQADFRASLGFCSRHAYMMVGMGNGLGTSILYRAASRELLKLLSQIPDSPRPQVSLRTVLRRRARVRRAFPEPGTRCTVCRSEEMAEEIYLQVLLDSAQSGSLDGLLDGPGAICIRHLSRASGLAGGWLPPALVEATRNVFGDLEGDLGLYVRRNDHRYSDEPWGKERDSWKRIVAKMVGLRRT